MFPGYLSHVEAGELGPVDEYFPLFIDGPGRFRARMVARYGKRDSRGELFIASFPQVEPSTFEELLRYRWPAVVSGGTVDGRGYVMALRADGKARVLLNLGDATVFVSAPDSETALRVIAALKKAN